MSKVAVCFSGADTFYLANTFPIWQLRQEIRWAEAKRKSVELFGGTEYLYMLWGHPDCVKRGVYDFPFADYIKVCREAIRWQRAGPKPAPAPAPARGKIDTEAIKARNDIVAVVEGYTKLRKSGRNFTGRCPVHQDKNPSLTVYPDSQTWHCYGCNQGGDVISFIQAVESCDFRGAIAILGGT